MKNIVRRYLFPILTGIALFTSSCDETFLQEVPKDFLSPENAYVDAAGFEAALVALPKLVRDFLWETDGQTYFYYSAFGTDFANFGEALYGTIHRGDYSVLSSQDSEAGVFWRRNYNLIKNANVIITRAESEAVKWSYSGQKEEIIAEAKFYRAWAHRNLAELYGGVPIVDYEITAPKLDFVRASREDVYKFVKEDLQYAAANLPHDEKQPGRVTKAAANHLLAEINICLGDYQSAVNAASAVIDDPAYELMTERFGKRTSSEADVYWDLFQRGNINRADGNKEAIWVIQWEYNTIGGETAYAYGTERAWGARYWSIKDPDGKDGFVLSDSIGRPVGWIVPTYYLQQTIWQDDWNDMRNSKYNIMRNYYYNNPASAYYGQLATHEVLATQELRFWHPTFMKAVAVADHEGGIINTGRIWKDTYMMRLAETYLLRAEAYLGMGNKEKAAADINEVRDRAHARPVDPADVTIDYILDERARELVVEEWRLLTLTRLGLLYDRVKNYNKILQGDGTVVDANVALTIQPHNNLWPIYQGVIDANSGAVLEQNPGY
jgi:hypothetical protein